MFKNRIAVNIAFFINGFIYSSWVSRLPRIQDLFTANDKEIGFVLLCCSLGAVGAMPFTGWIIIKNGSRKITLASLLLYCFFFTLIPYMGSLIALMFWFVVMGAVTGMLDVAMNAQAVMVEQHYKKPIMTSFHAFFSIGMTLGAWAGSLFAKTGLPISAHFFVVAVPTLVAFLWARQNLISDKPTLTPEEGPLFRLPQGSLIVVGIIAFCCMMGEGSMADWLVNYMENIAHASPALAPIALSFFALAMTGGRIFGDKVRVLMGDKRLIVLGGAASTVGILLITGLPSPYVIIAGSFLVGLGLSTIVPITYSIAGKTKDLPSGVGLAMVTTVGYTGFLVGPPLIGFVAEWQSLRVGLALVAFLFVLMTLLGLSLKKH